MRMTAHLATMQCFVATCSTLNPKLVYPFFCQTRPSLAPKSPWAKACLRARTTTVPWQQPAEYRRLPSQVLPPFMSQPLDLSWLRFSERLLDSRGGDKM